MTVTYNDDVYYYLTNLQGDIVSILNASGTAVVNYTYNAWGAICAVTGTMANTLGETNPLRYRGYVYDTESGLYYLQSRYYDPEVGRFLNADAFASTGQGILGYNMFAYCNNNPIVFSDTTGNAASILVPLVTSALMTGVAGAVSTFLAGGSAEEILLAGVLGGVFGAMAFGISFLGNLSAGAALLLRGAATFTNSLSLTYLINGEVTSTDILLASMDAAGDMMFSCIGYYWNGEWIDSSTLENCANAVYDAACDVAQTGLFFSEYAAHPASTTSYTSSSHSGTVRQGSPGSLVVNVLYVY